MRGLREARGLSQTQVAELSGVSERTVRAIERGAVSRPQHESLRRIAAVLAYGEGHQRRLVDNWTGASVSRTPGEIGIPDWQTVYQRFRRRTPEEGGQSVSTVTDATVGPDRRALRHVSTSVYDAMSAEGPPAIWNLTGGMPLDISTVRLDVRKGGVLDDFFVNGEVAVFGIRPEPHGAQRGPFMIEYAFDFSAAPREQLPVEREWMSGAHTVQRVATTIVRFTDEIPRRVWSVRGETAASIETVSELRIAADGTVQASVLDFVGVHGIRWEWDDDEPTAPGEGG